MPFSKKFEIILGGLEITVLATEPKARGFKPSRGQLIFMGDKNPHHIFLRRGSKAIGLMSKHFTAC
jgi:hypothetical protein